MDVEGRRSCGRVDVWASTGSDGVRQRPLQSEAWRDTGDTQATRGDTLLLPPSPSLLTAAHTHRGESLGRERERC